MKHLFLLTLFIPFTAYAQTDIIIPKPKEHKFFVGASITPEIGYFHAKNADNDPAYNWSMDFIENHYTSKLCYTAGLNAGYKFNSLISLESGVHYSEKGYQTKNMDEYVWAYDGSGYPAYPDDVKFIYSFHYIDIPVKVNFTIGHKKLRFITGAGVVSNFYLITTSTSIFKYTDGREEREKDISRDDDISMYNVSATVSAGVEYAINNKYSLRAEPNFHYMLTPLVKDDPISVNLYTGGLNLSFMMNL